jgi:hypothetical protein
MAGIIGLDRAAAKFVRNSGTAGASYEEGVRNPRKPWAESAAAAETNYRDSVTQAATQGRYGKGVRKAGNQKWQTRASTLGAQRFPSGVAMAAPDWTAGFAPYHQAISAAQLPPRRPARDPANRLRINAILDAVIRTADQQMKS